MRDALNRKRKVRWVCFVFFSWNFVFIFFEINVETVCLLVGLLVGIVKFMIFCVIVLERDECNRVRAMPLLRRPREWFLREVEQYDSKGFSTN